MHNGNVLSLFFGCHSTSLRLVCRFCSWSTHLSPSPGVPVASAWPRAYRPACTFALKTVFRAGLERDYAIIFPQLTGPSVARTFADHSHLSDEGSIAPCSARIPLQQAIDMTLVWLLIGGDGIWELLINLVPATLC